MDTGFRYDQATGSGMNRHAISFQPNAADSTSEMIMMGDYYQMNRSLGNPVIANNHLGFAQSVNSSGSVLGDSALRLKHVAGLAVEWSVEEQHKLDEGLSKYAHEPSIMRYIKIAATLRDKTVRDVALRCRWIANKRRKQDEPLMGRKLKDKKDNLVESSPKQSTSVPTFDVHPFSATMKNQIQIDGMTFEALSGSVRNLLEQNNQVLGQISANISLMKLQDNIDLVSHTRNNITAILNNMRYIPGPPFPVSVNEDLAHSILPATNQRMLVHASRRMHMKQEPVLTKPAVNSINAYLGRV